MSRICAMLPHRKQALCNHPDTPRINAPGRYSYRPCCNREVSGNIHHQIRGLRGSVSVAVLTDMMARNLWPYSFPAPAMLGLIDPSKAGFILKHQPNLFTALENFLQFTDSSVNFFEASTASRSALFGCLLLGSFFDHPCRCSTKYIWPCPVSWPTFSS